jgi:hypothetical protein
VEPPSREVIGSVWNLRVNTRVDAPKEPRTMRNCAFCKNPLRPTAEWKGSDGRFYCNEFCADAGEDQAVHVIPKLPEMTAVLRRT